MKNPEVERAAEVAVLAAECRASRHNDECANYCTAGVGPRHDEDEWADASTTLKAARAEGETAGYAKGRREAFSEAAEIVRTWAQDHECIQPSFGRMAAALRAKAGEGDPK